MVSNLLDKQECSCTTTEHTPLDKWVIILSLVGKKEKCYTKCRIVFTFKILVAFSFSELDNLILPTPTNTSLSCELLCKLNDHLSLFKASKRRRNLFPTNFSFKRPVPFVWLLANIRLTTTLNSNQRLRYQISKRYQQWTTVVDFGL